MRKMKIAIRLACDKHHQKQKERRCEKKDNKGGKKKKGGEKRERYRMTRRVLSEEDGVVGKDRCASLGNDGLGKESELSAECFNPIREG